MFPNSANKYKKHIQLFFRGGEKVSFEEGAIFFKENIYPGYFFEGISHLVALAEAYQTNRKIEKKNLFIKT